jgi:phage gp46-like protein
MMFTGRLAAPSFVPPDGDRRGWWRDSYSDRPIGSRLWMLDRARKDGQAPSLLQARDHCGEALRWPVEDGIAANVEVQTECSRHRPVRAGAAARSGSRRRAPLEREAAGGRRVAHAAVRRQHRASPHLRR